MKPGAILLPAFAAVAACTQSPGAGPTSTTAAARDCFRASSVNGFTARSDEVVDVKVGANRHYRLQLAGVCPHADFAQQVALVARGGQWICQGLDADLIVPMAGIGPQRCTVTSVRRLSDAEVQALRAR